MNYQRITFFEIFKKINTFKLLLAAHLRPCEGRLHRLAGWFWPRAAGAFAGRPQGHENHDPDDAR
jgi:hypothetical protein